MPESKSPESKDTSSSSLAEQVVSEAMAYVNRGNPYCWGGKGQALTDKNVKKIAEDHPSKNKNGHYDHLKPGGKSYSKVNKSGQECVDCSGMTQRVFKKVAGINIGTGTEAQYKYGKNLGLSNAKPGDLLVRRNGDSGHAAIMGTGGKMIEAKGKDYGCTHDRKPKSDMRVMRVVSGGDSVTSGGSGTGVSSTGSDNLLTSSQEKSAIQYNKSKNQSICVDIQKLVGASPDGSFGPKTVNAIAKWQKSKGLEVDGKFGPACKKAAGFTSGGSSGGTEPSAPAPTTEPETPAPAPAAPVSTPTTPGTHKVTLTSEQIQSAVQYNKKKNQSICVKIQNLVGATPDGSFGPKTVQAIADWQASKGLEVDGKFGPACKKAAGFTSGASDTTSGSGGSGTNVVDDGTIPSQSKVRTGNSKYGKPMTAECQKKLTLPYPMYYNYGKDGLGGGSKLTQIPCHSLVHERIYNIFKDTLSEFGEENVHKYRLDVFSGAYVPKTTGNSGSNAGKGTDYSKLSMHSWGIAFDIDGGNNPNRVDKKNVDWLNPESAKGKEHKIQRFWDIVNKYGGYSLGKNSNRDWMHVQFASFK